MMKCTVVSIVGLMIFALLYCSCKEPVKQDPPASKYAQLLNLYQPVSIDTFKVFSADNPDSTGYKFYGKKVDTSLFYLFPKKMTVEDTGVFAAYQFKIDTNTVGLITRTPGQYTSSSIKLLVYDKTRDTIADFFELAESWGDAGDVLNKVAWIYQTNDHKTNYLLWEEISHDGHIDEDSKDTTVTYIDNYYLLGVNKAKHDTISNKAEALFKKFKMKK